MQPTEMNASFRKRFQQAEVLLGTFIKTPTSHGIEILGGLGFDFVVIDAEHAPFDRGSIDLALLAARASGTAGIVRVAEPTAASMLGALDCGAAGVLVPHVASVAVARQVVAACRYRTGRRGFTNTSRAGDYGRLSIWDHVDHSDAGVTVVAMIEDPEALDDIEAIVAVEGLDGFFIGRGDLTVALGAAGPGDTTIRSAAERVLSAAREVGKPVCLMVTDATEAQAWRSFGASAFIVSSDQGFLRQAAARTYNDFVSLRGDAP
jgi:2-keto-3-deoxy-L-rhamnonate aldolase RhmA